MAHWIVIARRDGQAFYGHQEADVEQVTLKNCRAHIGDHEVYLGPFLTAEAGWIAWHKKQGNFGDQPPASADGGD